MAEAGILCRDNPRRRVYRVAWGTHLDIIRRCCIPENKPMLRQNCWECGVSEGQEAVAVQEA